MTKITSEITKKLKQKEEREELLKALTFSPIKSEDLVVREYDDKDYINLEGGTSKDFYLVKGFSYILKQSISKPNSYVTYLDNIGHDVVPEYISTLIKEGVRDSVICEVLSSQILNFFGAPTVYNFAIDVNGRNNRVYKLASIDSISEGETFETFYNCLISSVPDLIMKDFEGLNKLKLSPLEKQKMIEDCVMSFLVRRCLLCDFDFEDYNTGLLGNKMFNFDFESTFWETDVDLHVKEVIDKIIKEYAKILSKFMTKLRKLSTVYDEAIKEAPGITREFIKNLISNSEKMQQVIKELKSINTM